VPPFAARAAITALGALRLVRAVPDQVPRLLLRKSADIGPAVHDLGFAPRPLEEGVAPLLR
jgi:hypothetical protein